MGEMHLTRKGKVGSGGINVDYEVYITIIDINISMYILLSFVFIQIYVK
jgi:hypothetical protein